MAKMWCINCQVEREHRPVYGGENFHCSTCGMNTLAYVQPRTNETQEEMIKQMVGEAQRKALANNLVGNVEVKRISGSVERSDYQTQILVYNTYTRQYHFNRR